MQGKIKRLLFIDLFRGFAVIKMIEGHVVRALISPKILFFTFNPLITFIDGLTGPAFLFISGVSFSIVLKRHKEDFLQLNKKFFSRVQRILFIIFVGYWLHLPFLSFRKTISTSGIALREFLKIDILQCIGVSLLILQFLFIVVRKESLFNWLVFGGSLAILFSTPFVLKYDFPFLPLGIESYFKQFPISKEYLSLYPLFHWSVYVFFGYLTASIFFSLNDKNKGGQFILTLMLLGTVLIFTGAKTGNFFAGIYGSHFNFWYGSPNIFFMRLGALFIIFGFLYFSEKLFIPISKPIKTFGVESLHAYWLHLVLLFGSVLPIPGIVKFFPNKLGLLETFSVFLALTIFVYFTSYFWNKLKETSPLYAKIILRGSVALFLLIFLIRKY